MKKFLLLALSCTCITVIATAQQKKDTIRVLVENEKIKLTEYVSSPGKDICGPGMHSHPAHLSIMLTDAVVRLTMPDGKKQDFNLKTGTAFWSDAESHMVINNGNKTARVYLVELKQ
jgi:hypothetical protein